MPKLQVLSEIGKIPIIVQENIDKILQDYDIVESQLNNYIAQLPKEYQDSLTKIKSNVIIMKNNYLNLYEILTGILSQQFNESSTSNSDNSSYTITPRMKNSYDLISNELKRLEKINHQLMANQAQIAYKKKRRILLLEQNLQNYLDDVKHFDYTAIASGYNECFSGKNKIENVSQMLKNNKKMTTHKQEVDITFSESEILSFCENELTIEYKGNKRDLHDNEHHCEEEEEEMDNNSNIMIQTEIKEDDILLQKGYSNSIVNQIAKMNVAKKEEMIEMIQSLLSKDLNSNHS